MSFPHSPPKLTFFDLGRLKKTPMLQTSAEQRASLKTFLRTALQTVVENPTILQHHDARKALREAVYSNLIGALGATDQPSPPAEFLPQRSQLVAKARQHLYEHRDEVSSVADVCSALNVSRRSLQYAFQDVLGMNPVAYLRALRLNGVRRELKAAKQGTAVLDVAAHWGFWHPSHFSADYKRMFGELPSATLRRCVQSSLNRKQLFAIKIFAKANSARHWRKALPPVSSDHSTPSHPRETAISANCRYLRHCYGTEPK